MTTRQKVLALEAALCALESESMYPDFRDKLQKLHIELLSYLDEQDMLIAERDGKAQEFGDFLNEQAEAVKLLSESPAVFGCS
jgi:hypothetical protein